MKKDGVVKFLKIYVIFFLCTLLINLSLEIFLRFIMHIPESLDVPGIIMFFSIFNLVGAFIFFNKEYDAKKMGLLSLLIGQICEFTFMKPEWVQNFYALQISMDAIAPFIISSLIYWFPAWAIPSYIFHKYVKGSF